MNLMNQLDEMKDPEIERTAAELVAETLQRPGMNEWRTIFVAVRMIAAVMGRIGCRGFIGHTVCGLMWELAGEEEMARLDRGRTLGFAERREGGGGGQEAVREAKRAA